MKNNYFITLFLLVLSKVLFAQDIVINEVDSDQPTTDSQEFIELKTSSPNMKLDGYIVVLFNGTDNASYGAYDLAGKTSNSEGLFVIAADGSGDMEMDKPENAIQNGADAIAIYKDAVSNFPSKTPVTSSNLIDALVYGTSDADDAELLAGLNQTTQYDENANQKKDEESIQRTEDGKFGVGAPTQGKPNDVKPTEEPEPTPAMEVATVAELRKGTIGNEYILTTEAIITYMRSSRNQKYIQDKTAGILIDDNNKVITSAYNQYDGIKNLKGKLSEYNGVLQFIPTENPGNPASTGNALTPETVNLSDFVANPENYESELIKIQNVSFENAGENFEAKTSYNILSNGTTSIVRTNLSEADYIGKQIPTDEIELVALGAEYKGTGQLIPRDLNDFVGVTIITPEAIEVNTIAELRKGVSSEEYILTGEAIISYMPGFRNQKYIQDATGGILIDDNNGIITSAYNQYDGIKNLKGKLSEYRGTLQFIPSEDPGEASSTGNKITPKEVTLIDYVKNSDNYESQLIKINDVVFKDGGATFETGKNYEISSNGTTANFRTNFKNADYIGKTIPEGANNLVAIASEFHDKEGTVTPQLTASNMVALLNVKTVEINGFNVYPNPAKEYISITTSKNSKKEVTIYNILGSEVLKETLYDKTLNVSGINSGAYILKVVEDGKTAFKKIVIK